MEKQDLSNSKIDKAASVIRGTLGAIPVAGAAISEIVNSAIPNQRIDRIAKYLELLQKYFSESDFEEIKKIPEKIALLEEGILASGLTTQNSRINRIAHIVANGLTKKSFDNDHYSLILQTVKSLSDSEIIILEYYNIVAQHNEGIEAKSFKDKHPEIWLEAKLHPTLENDNCSEKEIKQHDDYMDLYKSKQAYLKGYDSRLISLALLERAYDSLFFHNVAENGDYNRDVQELQDVVRDLIEEPRYQITQLGLEILSFIKLPSTYNNCTLCE